MPAVVAELHPDEQKAVVDDGHEVGIHGWIHEFNSDLTETEERDIMMGASDVLERITGNRPVGIRTPSWDFTPYTLKICREMELLYDSSLMADDEPYELLENGEPTGHRVARRMDQRRRSLHEYGSAEYHPASYVAFRRARYF